MRVKRKKTERRENRRSFNSRPRFSLHPLFLLVGAWYCIKGELFLFLASCLVAVQHECAHAFAAAKLGYKLNRIVLMPFGAVIDGDLRGISPKDEITVAVWGPLCNLFTAGFFAALWWFAPTTYAFTDTACYTSLAIAIVNSLPAYPLDGGRVLRALLVRAFLKRTAKTREAERRAERVCRAVTFLFSALLLLTFVVLFVQKQPNFSLLAFGVFLLVGGFGNREKDAVYDKMDFSCKDALKKGVELRRVAVLDSLPVKDALKYITQGSYLVLEVYDERENKLFDLPQNALGEFFLASENPNAPLSEVQKWAKNYQKSTKNA